jgi:hypothetical protein
MARWGYGVRDWARCLECGGNAPVVAWNIRSIDDQRSASISSLTADNARLTAEVERLRTFISGIGVCWLAQSHGCDCPMVEAARDLLAGEKGE